MTEKRFKIYTDQIDHWTIVGLDLLQESTGRRLIVADIENILNDLYNENEQLKKLLECSREEANDYCEELMGKDEFIRLYKRQIDEVIEENEKLKQIIAKDIIPRLMNGFEKSYKDLEEENKKLKEEIKDLNDVLARYEEKELEND